MVPLRISAQLDGALCLPAGAIALDALLASAVAIRDALPPAPPGQWTDIEIPVQREPGSRFHLASFAEAAWVSRELRRLNRRFPLAEAQDFGGARLRRVDLGAGPTKSFRIPLPTGHVEGDLLTWWCVGEQEEIAELLAIVPYVGKKRSVGYGRVLRWDVQTCATWDGFPVVRDGRALRPLPPDWPGLVEPPLRYARLSFPYWAPPSGLVAVPT